MGRKNRLNTRRLRAIAEIHKMQRSSARALNKMRRKKGDDTEKTGFALIASLLSNGLIKKDAPVERWSFMDVVRKVDRVVIRLDGMSVPIQFKSSPISSEERSKYRKFVEKFGDFPVFVVIARDIDEKRLENVLLQKINSWKGKFSYEDWQLKYSKFFDFLGHPGFGNLSRRKMIFFSNKKREEQKIREPQENQLLELNPS